MQQMVKGDEFVRRLRPLTGLGADRVDPLHQAMIEFLVAADRVVDPRTPFDQTGKDVVYIADGEGIISAVVRNRAILTRAQTIP